MKTRKILILMVMFLFLTTLIVVMPNIVSAAETMSDEFKQILNEEGKLEVTDSTMSENTQQFLYEYLQKYQTDSYWFALNDKYDETHYSISRIDWNTGEPIEAHDLELVFEEKYSDDFKKILKDGKLQISSSNKDSIYDYIASMSNVNYIFEVASYYNGSETKPLIDENYTKATISMRTRSSGQLLEQHMVSLLYVTEPSDAFKTILKDGKFQIPSSCKEGAREILQNYLTSLSQANEKYTFYVLGFDENSTKVTIKMSNKAGQMIEQHDVELSYLTEQSEEFKKELNKDGKLVFNSIKPRNEYEMYDLFYLLFILNNEEKGYSCSYISEDFSSINLTINDRKVNQETHKVEIVYNYDKTIKQKLQGFINNFPEDIEYFHVKDLELINYWINNVETDDTEHLDSYSGELKSAVNNSNIEYYVDNRAGEDEVFFTVRLGVAIFKYNGIIYHIDECLGTKAENVIYVPDTTGNSKEELIIAAQNRINEYLGNDNIVKVSYAGKAKDIREAWIKNKYEATRSEWERWQPNLSLQEWEEMYLSPLENPTGIDGISENDDTFKVTVKVGKNEKSFNVIIKKGSSKMVTPSYKTADMTTNIEVSSSSTSIPLDASIQANKITSGTEYEKIIKLLDVKENAMFDLKLYSDSLEKYVTKLEDGEFEVKIPVPDNLKDKKLVAYYTDGTGEPETYEVEMKDGYAIFNTKHFSIYTLAEIKATEDNNNNNGETTDNNNNNNNTESGNTGNTNTESNNTETNDNNTNTENTNTDNNTTTDNSNNPKTGDNILFFVGMLLIAVIGIITTTIVRKYYKNK